MVATKRIAIDLTDEQRERVRSYAEREGLRMPRAYSELIEVGLERENNG